MGHQDHYLGNPLLKPTNYEIEWTEELVLEYKKCMDDPVYFTKNYIKIVSLDEGLVKFNLYPFQEKIIRTAHEERFVICKIPRQSGKTTTFVSYILHYIIFNANMNVAILANKASTARDILYRLQLSYENLPKWLQQGILSWNKGSLELENGSRVTANSTSSSAVRGGSYNLLLLDEFAFIPNNIAEEFFSSVYPTITSGNTTKLFMVSTPNGMNMFYRLWTDAEEGTNDYVPIDVHWKDIPGRDQAWKEKTIRNTSKEQFAREFDCDFIGSSNTLIPANILRNIKINHPIKSNAGLDVYENPIPEHTYATVVDVSRGVSKDYSAFVVFDVTQLPYKIVAKYRNNEIKPLLFPQIIYETSMAYNKAYVLVEVNDIGEQVASAIHFDHEYDNMMQCSMRGRAGQVLGEGYSGAKVMLGVKTTKQVKKIGCSNLKQIIEDEKLVINDLDIIDELSTFALHGSTFKAEQGRNDDLVMCCVLFSWAAEQPYFKELTDIDIRKRMLKEQEEALEQDMAPFGFISNGLEDSNIGIMHDGYGTKWSPISIEGGNW